MSDSLSWAATTVKTALWPKMRRKTKIKNAKRSKSKMNALKYRSIEWNLNCPDSVLCLLRMWLHNEFTMRTRTGGMDSVGQVLWWVGLARELAGQEEVVCVSLLSCSWRQHLRLVSTAVTPDVLRNTFVAGKKGGGNSVSQTFST